MSVLVGVFLTFGFALPSSVSQSTRSRLLFSFGACEKLIPLSKVVLFCLKLILDSNKQCVRRSKLSDCLQYILIGRLTLYHPGSQILGGGVQLLLCRIL